MELSLVYFSGHVEEGEDNMETAKRETKEEAGIDDKDLKISEFTKSLRVRKLFYKLKFV